MKQNKSQKGFSLPSVIVGSIIAAILGGMALSSMWGSVDKSKVNTLASIIKEQRVVFSSEPKFDYDALNTDSNTADYYADLAKAGVLTPIPDVFQDKTALTWEIRKMVSDGYKLVYYSDISSTNAEDQALIDAAIEQLNFNSLLVHKF